MEIQRSYVWCFVDQLVKTVFSDLIIDKLKSTSKDVLQKNFGSQVLSKSHDSEEKDGLLFARVIVKFQPLAAMIQSVLKADAVARGAAVSIAPSAQLQTSIFIEHIAFNAANYLKFILAAEKIQFFRKLKGKSPAEQESSIARVGRRETFADSIIADAIANSLLPKHSFSLTSFDSIYVRTNISINQIDSAVLSPFITLDEDNAILVDALFLINNDSSGG